MLTRVIRLLCLSLIVSALGATVAEADVQAIANPPSALGLARTPGGLAYIDVTDRTVREITLAGAPTRSFPIGADGSPTGLAVAPDGETYVSFDDGTTPGRIERYTAAGAPAGSWATGLGVCALAASVDSVFAAETEQQSDGTVGGQVERFTRSGDPGGLIGPPAAQQAVPDHPWCPSVAIGAPGTLLVGHDADRGIDVYDVSTGTVVRTLRFSGLPLGYGWVIVAGGPSGAVYVIASGVRNDGGAIWKFSPAGDLVEGVSPPDPFVRHLAFARGLVVAGDVLYSYEDSSLVRVDGAPVAALQSSDLSPAVRDHVGFSTYGTWRGFGDPVSYSWDLDGDGTFEVGTGTDGNLDHVFSASGPVTVTVRASANGLSSTASVYLLVRPDRPVGVSIDDGARYTNDPNVTLVLSWPNLQGAVTVSDDGGFAAAQTFPVRERLPWRLETTGAERLPKTVYVRFGDSTQTYQDDIVLDQTSPVLDSAQILNGTAAARAPVRTVRVRLNASDNVSGLAAVQFAGPDRQPRATVPYAPVVADSTRQAGVFVRVRDFAGNFSPWRQAVPPRSAVRWVARASCHAISITRLTVLPQRVSGVAVRPTGRLRLTVSGPVRRAVSRVAGKVARVRIGGLPSGRYSVGVRYSGDPYRAPSRTTTAGVRVACR